MKLLITGGTGFIGSRYIERYPCHEYTVLVRDVSRVSKNLLGSITCIESLDQLENLDDFDGVINLAGEPIIDQRWSLSQKDLICQSRWHITEQLVGLFNRSECPPQVFLSGSAIGIYGDHGSDLIDESTSVSVGDFPSTVCVIWEQIASRVQRNVRMVNLRTGIVLAKDEGALAKMLLPFKLGLGSRLGNGEQYMSWIHIDDMTAAIEFLINERGVSGPVNLVSPKAVNNRAFTKKLGHQLKRFTVLPVPGLVLRALMGESSVLLLGSQRIAPEKLMSMGFEFQFPSLESALADLLD